MCSEKKKKIEGGAGAGGRDGPEPRRPQRRPRGRKGNEQGDRAKWEQGQGRPMASGCDGIGGGRDPVLLDAAEAPADPTCCSDRAGSSPASCAPRGPTLLSIGETRGRGGDRRGDRGNRRDRASPTEHAATESEGDRKVGPRWQRGEGGDCRDRDGVTDDNAAASVTRETRIESWAAWPPSPPPAYSGYPETPAAPFPPPPYSSDGSTSTAIASSSPPPSPTRV